MFGDVFFDLVGQILAEQAVSDQRHIDLAESFEGQRSQTSPHRIAHQQRAGQDGHGRRDA
ncbi:MAG TPA: hypothetical protein DD670_08000 [Planctomycetaceae bacterium]|nr:hypothetical protein [Planctomycetaceae bacterium]